MANCAKNTKAYENKLTYIKKYSKDKYKSKNISFNTKNPLEAKMMEYLDSQESQNAFLKELIINHMIQHGVINSIQH